MAVPTSGLSQTVMQPLLLGSKQMAVLLVSGPQQLHGEGYGPVHQPWTMNPAPRNSELKPATMGLFSIISWESKQGQQGGHASSSHSLQATRRTSPSLAAFRHPLRMQHVL